MPCKRSREGELKRIIKKAKRVTLQLGNITEQKKKDINLNNSIKITSSTCYQDSFGGVILLYLRNVINKDILKQFEEDIKENFKKIITEVDDVRGVHETINMGYWTGTGGTYHWRIIGTPATRKDDTILQLACKYKELWEEVTNVIELGCPLIAKLLKEIPEDRRPFGLFPLGFLNWTTGETIHKDSKDWKDGIATVLPFGEYKGGELHFPDLNGGVFFDMQPGDIICFRSQQLQHGNLPVTDGQRHSIVLTCHNHFMKFIHDPRNTV